MKRLGKRQLSEIDCTIGNPPPLLLHLSGGPWDNRSYDRCPDCDGRSLPSGRLCVRCSRTSDRARGSDILVRTFADDPDESQSPGLDCQ